MPARDNGGASWEGTRLCVGNAFERATNGVDGESPFAAAQRSSSVASEGRYELTYAEQGSGKPHSLWHKCTNRGLGVAIVASEPITGTPSDWVAVPENHALTISREKSGYVNIIRSPLTASGTHKRQEEVSTCLEAIGRGISTTARAWSAKAPLPPSPTSQDAVPIVEREDDRISGLSAVLCIEIDVARQRLMSSYTDGHIRVWHLATHDHVHSWRAHDEPVNEIVLSGEVLYTTGGHRLMVWDLDTYACLYVTEMTSGAGTLRSVAVMDASIFVGGQDACVKLFTLNKTSFSQCNLAVGKMEWRKRTPMDTGHLSVIHCLEICGHNICSAGGDSMIRVWDIETLKQVAVLHGHRGSVLTCKGYGCILMSGGRDNTLRVWDLEALLCRRALMGHKDDVLDIALLCPSEGVRSSMAALDERLVFWVAMLGLMEASKRQTRRSLSIASTGGPCLVASCSADWTIRLWSMSTWACIKIFNLLRVAPPMAAAAAPMTVSSPVLRTKSVMVQQITPLSVALTRQRLYVGTRGGDILIWSIEDVVRSIRQRHISLFLTPFDVPSCGLDVKTVETGSEINAFGGGLSCRNSDSTLDFAAFESKAKELIERQLEQSLADFITIPTVRHTTSHHHILVM